jgi:hypothetical protein
MGRREMHRLASDSNSDLRFLRCSFWPMFSFSTRFPKLVTEINDGLSFDSTKVQSVTKSERTVSSFARESVSGSPC